MKTLISDYLLNVVVIVVAAAAVVVHFEWPFPLPPCPHQETENGPSWHGN